MNALIEQATRATSSQPVAGGAPVRRQIRVTNTWVPEAAPVAQQPPAAVQPPAQPEPSEENIQQVKILLILNK